MEEIWKDVVGYEGRYKVSNLGNVKSVIFSRKGKEKNLALLVGKDYLLVRLFKNGVGTMQRVHRLVAEAFLENPENYPVVNHKNWDKHDNRVENLEWCSYSYNNTYLRDGSKKMRAKRNGPLYHKDFASPKRVICIEKNIVFDSISEAARFAGVEQSNISRCVCGRQRTAGGYHWKYADEKSRSIGTLIDANGIISEWQSAEKVSDNVFMTGVFELDDLRRMRGRIRFLVRDVGDRREISICSADFKTDGQL